MSSWKVISDEALSHNVDFLRACVAPGVELCLVVKSNAYGHGLSQVLQNSALRRTRSIALADLTECASVGTHGLTIRCLQPLEEEILRESRELLEHALRSKIILSATNARTLRHLASTAQELEEVAEIDVLLDTGMHRGDAPISEYQLMRSIVEESPHLRLRGVSTHFCDSDSSSMGTSRMQLQRFLQIVPTMVNVPRHVANTDALLRLPESHLEMVRPGLGVFGLTQGDTESRTKLRPVMRWETRIIRTQSIAAGATVGYGSNWIATHATTIGLLPVGYADGLRRKLSNCGHVIVQGKPRRIVGSISMNLTTIDLGPNAPAPTGERAVLLDNTIESPASAYAWADHLDTSLYEILTTVGPHAPVHLTTTTIADVQN